LTATRSMSLSLDVPDEKKVDTLGETAFLETVQREGTDAENLAAEARAATEAEHKLTLLQGLKRYPKAVAWSLLISTCIM
jgi:SP family general alpha glucoside:H+ symporter-like MFS transporter